MAGYAESIGQRFGRDRAEALPLPPRPFDACITQPAQVDKYQTVRFDRNRYSVPRACAYQAVTVKGYVERVEVVAGGRVVARHPRSYGRDEQLLDPLHYLAALGRRPAALDHAPVLQDWRLARVVRAAAARPWRSGTARGPGRATTSACCNCWPTTRWSACNRPWSRACCKSPCRPNASSPRWRGWPRHARPRKQ